MENGSDCSRRSSSKDLWARVAKKTVLQNTVSLRKKQKPNPAVELQRHLLSIQNGHRLTKVRRNGKTFVRFFRADDTLLTFGYSDSRKSFRSHRNLKDQSTVHMNDVKEIREGATSDVFKKVLQKLNISEDHCLTIVIGGKFETLDLIAPSKEIRDNWVIGLKQIKRVLGEADLATQEEIQMHQLFQSADKNGDSILTLKEVVMLFRQMNLNSDLEHARRVFGDSAVKVTNKKGEECLNYKDFVNLYRKMTTMEELKQLFEKCARGGQFMDVNDVQDFFKHEQFEEKTRAECVALIKENEPAKSVAAKENLSLTGFLAMFKMPAFDVFNERHTYVYQDMTKPMSYYFINSSHNTYLAADQLLGNSSVEMYIRALKRGCRCVEIDCWNGDDGEPIVYHGHTLTSKILFRDVIAAINTYAFEASAYPVIVSLENHCNIEQQKVMASIMKQTFGDKIYADRVNEKMQLLPSPESLRDRIIIKNKKLSQAEVEAEAEGDLSSDDEDDDDIGSEVGNVPEELARERKKKVSNDKKKKLAVELSNLINICQSAGFKGFEYAQEKQKCYHISSIAEKKAMELSEDHGADWIKHNIRQMTRIYPAGTRTDSSNYDPMPLWTAGCQVVALNYQTADDPMIINGGFFLDNGNAGYVLKPSFMLDAQNPFDAHSGSFPSEWKKTLILHVISGYQLPLKKNDAKDIIDPAVEVEIVGVPTDHATQSTRFIENNGFHPVWDETLKFEVAVPNLAMVYFKVMDHETHGKDVVVAVFAAPFHSLRQGYRAVHLRSKHGEEIWGSYLFVHIRIE